MDLESYKYIVVEGPIGVGKTTLTRKLAEHLGAQAVLEQPQENPFLEKFYRDAARYALQTQMFFLFQRIQQLQELAQSDLFHTRFVGDFLLEKDPLFARLTLADEELKLYEQLYQHMRPHAVQPDLVIYLQAPVDTLVERIKKRGIPMEASISPDYLQRLCDSYSRFFYNYDAAPLLIVNNEHMNMAEREEDFQQLLSHIVEMRGKRAFLNRGE
ncbi:deoxynucleoside kinase [Herbaspirillum sp. meg3]|jgi:deoxyadenosine/deoxycytidine kinase|uniref:deoxynucleoside kinase n=1 Tax=Herbaspirillum sp. meg3 TaxID=2025949 RepID=UPI000B99B4F3|nr:deoxynucleoside kinase [Herbaspirillum sp. meg3]ASU40414.1 deoxynucleoside kinase [Herbaspirillum sp. meg3]